LPESIRAEERALAAFQATVAAEKKRLQELTVERKQVDLEIEAALAAIRKYRTQQFEVKKNDDYAALGRQIADEEHKKDKIEEKAIGLIEESERLEALLARRADEEKAKREELSGFRGRVDRDLEEVRGRLRHAEARRAELVRSTAPGLVDLYDKIRAKMRDGVAVVEVDRDSCSGCQTRLPPQRINELLRSAEVIRCEGCGRILVYASRSEDASRAG
jgi:predicted  nucleic acid-binding Zn-ribbon protein